jgi:dynactin 1
MYSLLLANENLLNETQIIRDCVFAIGAACDAIGTDAAIIQALIKVLS